MLNDHASLEKPKIVCVRKHGTNVGALWYGFKAAGFYQGLERLMHKTLTVYSGKLLVETILMVYMTEPIFGPPYLFCFLKYLLKMKRTTIIFNWVM